MAEDSSLPIYTYQWPVVNVDTSPLLPQQLELFKYLRTSGNQKIRSLQPRICLQCWMIISIEDAPSHKGHNQTSDFSSMEEASRASFLGLCKQYDRLTPDGKQAILMKVQRRITEGVEAVKLLERGSSSSKKKPIQSNQRSSKPIQEVDLTDTNNSSKKKEVPVNKKRPSPMEDTSRYQASPSKHQYQPSMDSNMGMFNQSQNMQPNSSNQLPQMFNQLMFQAMQQSFQTMNGNGKYKPGQKGSSQSSQGTMNSQQLNNIERLLKDVNREQLNMSKQVKLMKEYFQKEIKKVTRSVENISNKQPSAIPIDETLQISNGQLNETSQIEATEANKDSKDSNEQNNEGEEQNPKPVSNVIEIQDDNKRVSQEDKQQSQEKEVDQNIVMTVENPEEQQKENMNIMDKLQQEEKENAAIPQANEDAEKKVDDSEMKPQEEPKPSEDENKPSEEEQKVSQEGDKKEDEIPKHDQMTDESKSTFQEGQDTQPSKDKSQLTYEAPLTEDKEDETKKQELTSEQAAVIQEQTEQQRAELIEQRKRMLARLDGTNDENDDVMADILNEETNQDYADHTDYTDPQQQDEQQNEQPQPQLTDTVMEEKVDQAVQEEPIQEEQKVEMQEDKVIEEAPVLENKSIEEPEKKPEEVEKKDDEVVEKTSEKKDEEFNELVDPSGEQAILQEMQNFTEQAQARMSQFGDPDAGRPIDDEMQKAIESTGGEIPTTFSNMQAATGDQMDQDEESSKKEESQDTGKASKDTNEQNSMSTAPGTSTEPSLTPPVMSKEDKKEINQLNLNNSQDEAVE